MRKNLSHDSIRIKKPLKQSFRFSSELYGSDENLPNQPDLHLTGIILCLSLRKTFNSNHSRLKKFSFFLIRSLYIDSKRPSKLPKYPKKRQYSKTGKASLDFSAKKEISERSYKKLLRVSVIFINHLKKEFFLFKKFTKRSKILYNLKNRKFFKCFEASFRLYFKILTTPFPDYVKICATFEKYRIFQLIDSFNLWQIHAQELKLSSYFCASNQIKLPLPISIHDYIDDFYNITKEQIDASYFSFSSTREFTSRMFMKGNNDYSSISSKT